MKSPAPNISCLEYALVLLGGASLGCLAWFLKQGLKLIGLGGLALVAHLDREEFEQLVAVLESAADGRSAAKAAGLPS